MQMIYGGSLLKGSGQRGNRIAGQPGSFRQQQAAWRRIDGPLELSCGELKVMVFIPLPPADRPWGEGCPLGQGNTPHLRPTLKALAAFLLTEAISVLFLEGGL